MYHEFDSSPPPAAAGSTANAHFPIVLISPYELGRQPFGLAHATAWLRHHRFPVASLDLSRQTLDADLLHRARLVAIHLPMHTATRIAAQALGRIKQLAPAAHYCVFGLYAPVNRDYFRALGVHSVLGAEVEPEIEALALDLARARGSPAAQPGRAREAVNLGKIAFRVPDRGGLPPLAGYARLVLAGGTERVMGFTEASRGCKHRCRHCPVVPVYDGRFRVVPVAVVLADIRNQVHEGARHISFADPDFFNGPTHALRVVQALHRAAPELTYDVTIKVEHLLKHADLLPVLADTGCLFITSAVESIDPDILGYLEKNHSPEDFEAAVRRVSAAGIALAPTFVSFTPWTTLEGYRDLLAELLRLRLVESVPPVQLAIRLLVPAGSRLLELAGFEQLIDDFDPQLLGYPWVHRDPRVDALHAAVLALVEAAEAHERPRAETFAALWVLAHRALGLEAPALPDEIGSPIPHHSEPWYCCAEPTERQLQSF